MIHITFAPHATSIDNEKGLASGYNDIELSQLGLQQAKELGERNNELPLDRIYTSDLKRAYKTATIAFENRNIPIHKDARLREWDYGDMTQHPKIEVESERINRISTPFPNGESLIQATTRVGDFLGELLHYHDFENIFIIGHRATRFGLEHWIKHRSLEDLITENYQWQPAWTYEFKEL
ncbi:MAG: histidine phosphatase family protein [bacterium]|nr:histidine phosphatase family protein [bacterium]